MNRKKRRQREGRARLYRVEQRTNPVATTAEIIMTDPAGPVRDASSDLIRRGSDDFDRFMRELREKPR